MKKPILASSCFIALLPASMMAATIFADNFQGYSAGVLPEGGTSLWFPRAAPNTNDNGSGLLTRVVVDSDNHFGLGTDNQFLRLSDTDTTSANQNVGIDGTEFGTSGQISFDFYDPSGDTPSGQGYIFRFGNAMGNANTAFAISIQNGGIHAVTGSSLTVDATAFATYSLDQKQSLTLVFNNTNSAILYDDGSRSLAANTMDVWLGTTLVASGLAKSGSVASNVTMDSFSFTQKNGFRGVLELDNIVVADAITFSSSPVPEPASTAAFGAVAALALAGVARRRRA